jgi:hypothetical protein
MFLHVVEAKYVKDHTLWPRFNDGSSGEVDLSQELEGEMFESLQNAEVFKSFTLRGHMVAWKNDADFAPEFLKARLVRDFSRSRHLGENYYDH